MMQNKPKTNWLIDAVLFGGFLLTQWLDLTGLSVHQWLGLAVEALTSYQMVSHWRWVAAVTDRFFGRTSQQARTFYAVDAGLTVGFVAMAASRWKAEGDGPCSRCWRITAAHASGLSTEVSTSRS